MAYRVIYSPGAQKEIARLDKSLQKRIMTFVDKVEAADNPRFSGKALKGNDRNGAIVSEIFDWYVRSEIGS